MFLCSDSPKTHKFISKTEMDYIVEETKKEVSAREGRKLVGKLSQILS